MTMERNNHVFDDGRKNDSRLPNPRVDIEQSTLLVKGDSSSDGVSDIQCAKRGTTTAVTPPAAATGMATDRCQSSSPAVVCDDIATISSTSEETSVSSCLEQEVRRLQVLKTYLGALDSTPMSSFERLTSLASRIARTPMALVTVADLDKQYIVSGRGWDMPATMKSTFCSHTVSSDCDFLIIRDAAKDSRFLNDRHVAGKPGIRFYAGAPLVCPEGFKLGTLCVMDTKPRVNVTLDEKQGLIELAAMAMEVLVDLRKKASSEFVDPAQQIACTAHDLLTPLTGIALSLSLLRDDDALQSKLSEQQRDMIETAANCSAVMNSICQRTMDGFRDQCRRDNMPSFSTPAVASGRPGAGTRKYGPGTVRVADLVKNLNAVMEPFPKKVPLIITVDPAVPPEIVSDDMKIFRSATNYLSNACAKTDSGSIHLKIYTKKLADHEELIFECCDTGIGVEVAKYSHLFKPLQDESDPLRFPRSAGTSRAAGQNTGLGLYSVASQISSIGGKYGFRPRGHPIDESLINDSTSIQEKLNGSVFWFSVPLSLPESPVAHDAIGDKLAITTGQPMIKSKISAHEKPRPPIEQELELGKIDDVDSRRARFIESAATENGLTICKAVATTISSQTSLNTLSPELFRGSTRKRLNSTTAGRKRHALIIEDSLVVRKTIARALSKLDFEVTQATNGMEGLKELQRSLYDLVLCDFLMPVMDGLDCVQQYRQWEKTNRPYFRQYIVGISAHASEKDVQQGFKIGMNEFRSKPVTYKVLVDLKKSKEFCRVSLELDNLGQEVEALKRRKIGSSPRVSVSSEADDRVCLVVEGSPVISKIAEMATDRSCWKIVPVNDGERALELLKMRNWDAVLLDDEFSGSPCLAAFREWEKLHRVNRQNNVVLVSANFVFAHDDTTSFQAPTGFDAALGKPIRLHSLQSFLGQVAVKSTCLACDIVTR